MKLLGLLILGAVILPAPAPAEAPKQISVYGRVVDDSNEPVFGAVVELGAAATSTDDSGSFVLRGVPSGRHEIVAIHAGLATKTELLISGGRPVEIWLYLPSSKAPEATLLGTPVRLLTSPGWNKSVGSHPSGDMVALEVLDTDTLGFDLVAFDMRRQLRSLLLQTAEDDGAASFSPDGDMVAFRSLNEEGRSRVWIKDLVDDYRPPKEISTGDSPSWTLDGRHIVYARHYLGDWDVYRSPVTLPGLPGVWLRDNLTENPANDRDPSVGELDGREIVLFVSDRSGSWEVWILDAKTQDVTQLTHLEGLHGSARGPVLSPDSRHIAFWEDSSPPRVWLMAADGSAATPLALGARPEWRRSRGSDRDLFFSSQRSGAWQIYLTTVPAKLAPDAIDVPPIPAIPR